MDDWVLRQLRAMVLDDLDEHIPTAYFDQEVQGFDSNVKNSTYLSAELKWGILAAKLGRQLHFDSSIKIKPRQVSASELLMNLGMLAASKAQHAALENLSSGAKRANVLDGNSGAVAAQLACEHIPAFHDNIRGGLVQYFKYLSQVEQAPFRTLLDVAIAPEGLKPITQERAGTEIQEGAETLKAHQDDNIIDISNHRFKVALSFPGEVRQLVSEISLELKRALGSAAVFYDNDFIAQLARPSLDTLLQDLYRNRADLIVVFISSSYQEKKWCGVEFRAIREIIYEREHERVMFVRTGDGCVDGVFATDGYVDARSLNAEKISEFVIDRLRVIESQKIRFQSLHKNGSQDQSVVSLRTTSSTGLLDIAGRWDVEKGKQIADRMLVNCDHFPDMEKPIDHTFAGEFHLLYGEREGIILAYGSITKGSDCHACAPELSLFEFEKCDGGWRLLTSNIAVCRAGQWGQLPQLGVHAFADSKFGVLLQDGYMAQGWGIELTSLYVRVGDAFKNVLTLITSQCDPDGRSWSSKFAIRPTRAGLYEIEVQRSSERGPEGMVFMEGDEALKSDISDSQGNIRAFDLFKFDGQCYRRHEILR